MVECSEIDTVKVRNSGIRIVGKCEMIGLFPCLYQNSKKGILATPMWDLWFAQLLLVILKD